MFIFVIGLLLSIIFIFSLNWYFKLFVYAFIIFVRLLLYSSKEFCKSFEVILVAISAASDGVAALLSAPSAAVEGAVDSGAADVHLAFLFGV